MFIFLKGHNVNNTSEDIARGCLFECFLLHFHLRRHNDITPYGAGGRRNVIRFIIAVRDALFTHQHLTVSVALGAMKAKKQQKQSVFPDGPNTQTGTRAQEKLLGARMHAGMSSPHAFVRWRAVPRARCSVVSGTLPFLSQVSPQ